jgi:hypothetical protein
VLLAAAGFGVLTTTRAGCVVTATEKPAYESALGWTVHVLIGVSPTGQTDEATREVATWPDALAAANEAAQALPDWRAITIYRTEDQPRFLLGASPNETGAGS